MSWLIFVAALVGGIYLLQRLGPSDPDALSIWQWLGVGVAIAIGLLLGLGR